jgi:hypothetical protein
VDPIPQLDAEPTVPEIIHELIELTKNELTAKITATMTKEPLDCVPTAGLPGDGVDNNCNGVADDNRIMRTKLTLVGITTRTASALRRSLDPLRLSRCPVLLIVPLQQSLVPLSSTRDSMAVLKRGRLLQSRMSHKLIIIRSKTAEMAY